MKLLFLILIIIVSTGLLSCSNNELESQRAAVLLQSLEASIVEVEQLNKEKIQLLKEETEKRPYLRPIYKAAEATPPLSNQLLSYLNQLSIQKNISNSTIDSLENLIQQTRDKMIQTIDDLVVLNQTEEMAGVKFSERAINRIKEVILLNNALTRDYPRLMIHSTKSIQSLLLKELILETKFSSAQLINYFEANMAYGCSYDKMDLFASRDRQFIKQGDQYEVDIALGVFESNINYTIQINSDSLQIQDGKAKYSEVPTSSGTQSYTVKAQIRHPFTGKITDTLSKTFYYEVLPPKNNVSIHIQ